MARTSWPPWRPALEGDSEDAPRGEGDDHHPDESLVESLSVFSQTHPTKLKIRFGAWLAGQDAIIFPCVDTLVGGTQVGDGMVIGVAKGLTGVASTGSTLLTSSGFVSSDTWELEGTTKGGFKGTLRGRVPSSGIDVHYMALISYGTPGGTTMGASDGDYCRLSIGAVTPRGTTMGKYEGA
jgi:hypothetical protein